MRLFQGRPVLSRFENGVMIDTDYIIPVGMGSTGQPAEPVQAIIHLPDEQNNPLKDIPLET